MIVTVLYGTVYRIKIKNRNYATRLRYCLSMQSEQTLELNNGTKSLKCMFVQPGQGRKELRFQFTEKVVFCLALAPLNTHTQLEIVV